MTPDASILAVVKRTPVFSSLDEAVLAAFLQQCDVRALSAGRRVFDAGQEADRFFVVLEGRVKIFKTNARGDEQILHLYGPGESFGEAAMWSGGRFPASVLATDDVRLLVVRRTVLRAALTRNAELAMGMLAGLSAKLREFAALVEQLSLRDVPARLADVLLKERLAAPGPTIRLRQTKRELAAQIGTVPETLSRALKRMKTQGLITVTGARVTLLNERALRELAEGGGEA